MSEKKTYEAMFLLDSGNPDFNAVSEPVRNILQRRGAEVLSIKPWDDRKLAYEIRGRKRGFYILAYVKLDPLMVVEVEHDCALEERILRSLILRKDVLTEETINAPTPLTGAPRVEEGTTPAAPGAAPAAAAAAPDAKPEALDEVPPALDEIDDIEAATDESDKA